MTNFFGLYFLRVIGTNDCQNEPVPPVIKIEEFSNTFISLIKVINYLVINILQTLLNKTINFFIVCFKRFLIFTNILVRFNYLKIV